MCILYSITTNQTAIIALSRMLNRYGGNLAPMPGVLAKGKNLNMRSSVILTILLSLIACPPSNAADIYSCEIKERLLLNDDGLIRAGKMLESPKFMIDKNTGNAVGEIFY